MGVAGEAQELLLPHVARALDAYASLCRERDSVAAAGDDPARLERLDAAVAHRRPLVARMRAILNSKIRACPDSATEEVVDPREPAKEAIV